MEQSRKSHVIGLKRLTKDQYPKISPAEMPKIQGYSYTNNDNQHV